MALSACGGSHAADPAKPVFVFVHGAWHGGWCWSETVRLLAEQGYGWVALDLPGHGLTARLPASSTRKPQATASLGHNRSHSGQWEFPWTRKGRSGGRSPPPSSTSTAR